MGFSGMLQVDGRWICLQKPVEVVTAVSTEQIIPALQKIETAVAQNNLYAAGFITYEAAAALFEEEPRDLSWPLSW